MFCNVSVVLVWCFLAWHHTYRSPSDWLKLVRLKRQWATSRLEDWKKEEWKTSGRRLN